MEHRGARGAEPNTGDGAGVMIERPDALFEAVVDADLPETYAVGSFFFPPSGVESAKKTVERELATHDCAVVEWRAVPTDAEGAELGATARAAEPAVWQAFVTPATSVVVRWSRRSRRPTTPTPVRTRTWSHSTASGSSTRGC
jgi:glutamate synthase (NADPH/NADH) large chain